MTIHKIDSSKELYQISAEAGDLLELTLDENPTTGYIWQFDNNLENLQLVKDERKLGSEGSGSGSQRLITFKVLEKGDANILFVLKRPWGDAISKKIELILT